jgi:hypothetical protein
VAAFLKLSFGIIGKNNVLFAIVTNDVRLRVCQFAAARQLQKQESAGALKSNAAATDDTAAFTHRSPGGTIETVPKFYNCRMGSAPFTLELLDLLVGETIGKFPPSFQAAHIAKT